MPGENFRDAEDAYFRLRGQYDIGLITPEQFDEELREHTVQDSSGRYWMLGADSGKWYFYDGSNWLQGEPLSDAAPAATTPILTRADPARASRHGFELASAPTLVASCAGKRNITLVAILTSATLVILAVATFLVIQIRDRIFIPPQTPTRAAILHTSTSETDSYNTDTSVRTTSIPTPGIATREPTAQSVIVIPTVTPFGRNTPEPQLPVLATLPAPQLTVPASTPFFPLPPTVPPTGRLRVGNGPDARARYMPVPQFNLDGALDEWSGEGVPLIVPHFGADNWLGPGDLSGTAWLGWNENFLLIAVHVFDDAHVQTQHSWEMFRGDSVELWLDADLGGDFDAAEGNGDDYQFGVSPGNFANLIPEGVLYLPYRDAVVNQQILVAAQPTSTGYTLEAAIPWSVLRVQPGQGRVVGYTVDLSDNDVPNTAQQQTQVNHNPNFQFEMPTTFGNLILE